jgi:3',5'-nucleoside bisphosphate phosphatase
LDCNRQAEIDLHIHSNASDGSFSPSDILRHALKLGLKAISITDHDSLSGVKDLLRLGIPDSIAFLPGVEISARLPLGFGNNESCHILGYGIDVDNLRINNALDRLKAARINRNPAIIEKLNTLGINLTLDELKRESATLQIGRPHIAQVLVKKKIVDCIDDAFSAYLGYGKPAYVAKFRIDCAEAITLIRESGGIPVLAHPYLIKEARGRSFEQLVIDLKSLGLLGIEVYYPEHSSYMTAYYESLAKRFDLLITGGTDFHGALSPEIKMGVGKSNLRIPYAVYEHLVRAKQTIDSLRTG